jgi:tellurite resistance protein TerC
MTLIYWRLGEEAGVMWLNGYLLELIFSLENIFVFHIIAEAFQTPRRYMQELLFYLVCCQILWEMLLIMGLAEWLDKRKVLPYVLGIWLLYVGAHAAMQDDHSDFDIMETAVVRVVRWGLGDRLEMKYDDSLMICAGDPNNEKKATKFTLSFLVFCCLLIADFLLEVDVALTKIEELPIEYISFTSSVVAGFAVPELFFVGRDAFKTYYALKYGISFILLFYGAQMLLSSFFELPPLAGCAVIVAVMTLCMLMGQSSPKSIETDMPRRQTVKWATDYTSGAAAAMVAKHQNSGSF